MKSVLAPWAIVLGLVVALPLAANAQQPPNKQPGKAAPAPHAAPHVSAPRAAPHVSAPRAAPHVSAPRAVPHVSAPRPAARISVPHAAPRRVAAPRVTPHRAAVPHVTTRRAAAPHATTHRAATRHETTHPAAATPSVTPHAATVAAPQQTRATSRAAQRQERTLRRQEDRALRNTPRSQRAAKREEIRHAREQRVQQRQQAQPSALAQPNAATANTRAQRRALRRHRNGAVTAQSARQGRFASAFAGNAQAASTRRARRGHWAARRAWRHGLRAAFVPWYGPVYWPYAYSDIFDYAFWSYGYDDGFWAYAYDDFVDSLFWGEEGPPDEYVDYSVPPPSNVRHAAVEELCTQPGTGITAWPFAEIESKLALNRDQKALLGDVRADANKAAAVFKASCPTESAFPLTPPGRLRAMTGRLQATLEAVQTVRPALDKFYNSLSDEQKERFNELGPAKLRSNNAEASAALPSDTKACAQAKPGLTNLPIEQIDEAVKPSEDQEKSLDALENATDKAVSTLQAACPDETPLTPPGRLQAMETRLQAMVDAANTIKPALDDFYGSLSNEQKARFDRIGTQLAKSGG